MTTEWYPLGIQYQTTSTWSGLVPHIIKEWSIDEEFGRSYCGLQIAQIVPAYGSKDICKNCDSLVEFR